MNSNESKEANLREMRLILLENNLEVYAEPLPGPKADSLVQKEVESIASRKVGATAGALVRMWLKEKDSFYLDWALAYCRQREIGPTPTLWRLATELAELRYWGNDLPGRRVTILKEQAKQAIFALMINLIYSGETLAKSADLGAMIFKTLYPHLSPYKASTLEQVYSDEVRRSGYEAAFFQEYEKFGVGKDFQNCFELFRELVPEVDEKLKGERR
ncbi:hypothetical protein [Marinobacter salarius]|uniref:hypothetical protein n=1 Tax=Marinobacter salarius TaxID=1420917 RepID=UPI000F858E18|nr:hypothetical protein [Marinobacter salarius]AZR42994.1 hypothetical protein MTMN5_03561 [Marinobacter salarius]